MSCIRVAHLDFHVDAKLLRPATFQGENAVDQGVAAIRDPGNLSNSLKQCLSRTGGGGAIRGKGFV